MKIIIMAGGSGTRLYPLSTESLPKQFIPLADGQPLLINTIKRFLKICKLEDIIVVTGEKHKNLTREIMQQYKYEKVNVVYEPFAKNTAPAIMLGVRYCLDKLGGGNNESIFCVPSDHVIKPQDDYADLVCDILEKCQQDKILIMGVVPKQAHTGYGYIKVEKTDSLIKKVVEFKEKPDKKTAHMYLNSGDYFWNAGMLGFTPKTFSVELKKHAPSLHRFFVKTYDELYNSFQQIEKISIDYALAEKSKNILMRTMSLDWSDIGNWDSYYEFCEKDINNNVCIGNVCANDCKGCMIYCAQGYLDIIGQRNSIIISANGNVMVLPRGESESIKL